MKKYIALALSLIFVFSLAGCNSQSASTSNENLTNKAQQGVTLVDGKFETTVSYANWTDKSDIYLGALNAEKMQTDSVRHFLIFKFDTLKDLEQFKFNLNGILTFDRSYGEVPSFNEVTADYDKKFFKENTLMLVYVTEGSGSYRFGVNSIFCDGNSFCIHIKHINNPECFTCDMAGWFVTVAVPKSTLENCTEFDAVLNN